MSKRTRFLLGIGVIAALVIGWQVAAFAVHDLDVFELDGNADNNAAVTGADWDNVFAGTATGATATSFVSENNNLQASIFTGGGSKDPQDIPNWKWKDDAGGLPDKDNLLHSFAARYDTASGDDVLYFGSDRYDNSGDAVQGFWFFQNKVTQVGTGSGSFSGVHKNGDLLVLSDFSNGGDVSTINVFKWDSTCTKNQVDPSPVEGDCADVNLRLLQAAENANCLTVEDDDTACGIVNPGPGLTNAPWTFGPDKSGNTEFAIGEFFEGGVNLTDLGLANQCFSSVASETRSSTSTTAVLKDFVLGQLESCQATMTTQTSNTGNVLPGASVTDKATISVGLGVTAPDPTGTVTFFLCGPGQASPVTAAGCPTGGTNIGTGTLQNQTGGTTTDGIATATSPAVNTAASPLTPGTYCFRASWPGDLNYPQPPNTPLTHTNSTTECFTVQDTFSIGTTQSYIPQDKATITMAGGSAVAGTVQFRLYASEQQCNDNGGTDATGLLYQESVTVTNGTSPHSVSTNNDGVPAAGTGGDGDAGYSVTATDPDLYWRVTFTPTDSGITGTNSVCVEDSSVTINNT